MAAVFENLSSSPSEDDLAETGGTPAPRAAGRPPQTRSHTAWRDWAWTLAPFVVIAAAVLTLFRATFVHALTEMPGREVVQVIVAAFLVGLLLVCLALRRYQAEAVLLARWRAAEPGTPRERLLDGWSQPSWVRPLLRALGAAQTSVAERQALLEAELAALRERLAARMTAPNYLAGTLIGLGLVGTFLGLISTLGDLSRLFDGLTSTSRADVNPTELFADMVRRLQEPMRGMGTAFVSSLFGLAASLVLGLNAMTVGRVGSRVADEAAELARQFEAERAQALAGEMAAVADQERDTLALEMKLRAEEWRRVLDDLLEMQNRQERQALLLRGEIADMAEGTRTLANALRERLRVDRAPGRLLQREARAAGRRRGRSAGGWAPAAADLDAGAALKTWADANAAQSDKLAAEFGRVSQEQTGLMWNMSQNLEHLSELLDATLNRQLSLTLTVDPSRKSSA
jgi:hypothetical protein